MADEFTGYMRVFQGNNTLKPFKLYINDILIDSSFTYKEFTEYLECEIGCYNISLRDFNGKTFYSTSVTVNKNNVSTFVIYGNVDNIKTTILVDSSEDNYNSDLATIRYGNFINQDTAFDIYLNDNPVVIDLEPAQVSYYMVETLGENNFVARSSKTDKILLQAPKLLLKKGYVYTGYIVGDVDGILELVVPLEGVTYITPM